MNKYPPWVNLLLSVIALIAAWGFPQLANLNPPFDAATFVNIVVWLVEILLAAIFGWNVKAYRTKTTWLKP